MDDLMLAEVLVLRQEVLDEGEWDADELDEFLEGYDLASMSWLLRGLAA